MLIKCYNSKVGYWFNLFYSFWHLFLSLCVKDLSVKCLFCPMNTYFWYRGVYVKRMNMLICLIFSKSADLTCMSNKFLILKSCEVFFSQNLIACYLLDLLLFLCKMQSTYDPKDCFYNIIDVICAWVTKWLLYYRSGCMLNRFSILNHVKYLTCMLNRFLILKSWEVASLSYGSSCMLNQFSILNSCEVFKKK